MARRRSNPFKRLKKNPGLGPVVGLGILALGGYAVYRYVENEREVKEKLKEKSKMKPMYAIGPDCKFLEQPSEEEQQSKEFRKRALKQINAALREVGVKEPAKFDEEQGLVVDFTEVLGEPPGSTQTENVDFAQAWATALFKQGVHPKCLKSIGIPKNFAKETNQFGADYTEWGQGEGEEWPGDTLAYLFTLAMTANVLLESAGYDVPFSGPEGLEITDEDFDPPPGQLVNAAQRIGTNFSAEARWYVDMVGNQGGVGTYIVRGVAKIAGLPTRIETLSVGVSEVAAVQTAMDFLITAQADAEEAAAA